MQHATRVAVGSGSLKPAAAQDIHRGWDRIANAGRRAAAPAPQDLGAMGIGYRVVPREVAR